MKNSARELDSIAAEWIHRCEDEQATPETRAALEGWLAEDRRHRVAWLRMLWGWTRMRKLFRKSDSNQRKGMPEVVEVEFSGVDEFDHVRYSVASAFGAVVRQPHSRGWRWRSAGVSLLGLVLAVAVLLVIIVSSVFPLRAPPAPPQPSEQIFTSEVGEQRNETLTDGTQIRLDTASEVHVRLTTGRREVLLTRGGALFTVTHDARRPFEVVAGGDRVTDFGTEFSVRIGRSNAVEVLVARGQVGIDCAREITGDEPASAAGCAVLLPAGNGAALSAARITRRTLSPDELRRRMSWVQGFLRFDGEPLSEVVEELNRYTQQKIRIADPQIAKARISAVFVIGSPADFVKTLEMRRLVRRVPSDDPNVIVLRRAKP